MWSFLILSLIFICSESQSFCVFGRGVSNTLINGLYTDSGSTLNGKTVYSKDLDSNCASSIGSTHYMFWVNNTATGASEWRIADTASTSAAYYAFCYTSTTPTDSNPSSCSKGNWYVSENSAFVEDSNVFITQDSCPEWSCNAISTTIPKAGGNKRCQGEFYKDASGGIDNVWINTNQNKYFYYHPTFGMIISSSLSISFQIKIN